jgi:SHS2 domain-containing protein
LMRGGPAVRKRFSLEAFDRESLLVEWLGELAYSAEVNREVFYAFDFECVTDHSLIVVACGNRVDSLQTVIKAVTYHNLKIVKTDYRLEATVVFDV